MIHSYMGKPGAGMTLRSTPPVENSNPEGGPKGADGQGVCTQSGPCQRRLDGVACDCDCWRVENSNPEGGPKGADGQGVCTLSDTDMSLLRSYNERVEAHELLTASRLSRKFGPFAAAMFTARCALRSASEKDVEDFRFWGMLLHVGVVK